MNVSTFIAKRYLFSKKSRNIINIISIISFLGIFISASALVIILSAFNGIQEYVEDMYGRHAADMYIEPEKGKMISADDHLFSYLNEYKKNINYFKQIQETSMLKYDKRWVAATVIGLDSVLFQNQNWEHDLTQGKADLYFKSFPAIILGYGLQHQLQADLNQNFMSEISMYSVNKDQKISVQNQSVLRQNHFILTGVFSINPDIDGSTAIIDYSAANKIFNYKNGASTILIYAEKNDHIYEIKEDIKKQFPHLVTYSHEEKNKLIYAANDTEKWMVMAILIFVLLLSSFTITSSITMLIIDKKKDIFTLSSLGCNQYMIRNIFFKEGLLISLLGSLLGLLFGLFICYVQMEFKLITFSDASLEYWPIVIKAVDVILLLSVLTIVGFVSSYLPGRLLMKKVFN
tara:strand:- start:1456 stop:2664 length:1209 start_codon:yes stop_codon:yes gene_type:complete